MRTTLGEAEHGIPCHLVHEADAAAAHDATLVIKADARADSHVLGLFDLHIGEARDASAVAHGIFLQSAFAGLIANRAIQRMIDQQKLHHPSLAGFHQLARGANAHVFAHRIGAGNHRSGTPDDRFVA